MIRVYLIELSRTLPSGKAARYYVLRWYGSNGQRQSESLGRTAKSGGKVTKAEAEERRQKKEHDLSAGRALRDKPRPVTLQAFLDEHAALVQSKVSGGTQREYQFAGAHAVAALGPDVRLDRIMKADVARVESCLREKKLSDATVNKTLRALRAMFNRAVNTLQLVAANPFARWELPVAGVKEARIFSREEVAAMVAAAPSQWWKSFIRLAADSGLRKMELLHLRWQDVDFKARELRVRAHHAGTFTVGETTYPLLTWDVKAKASTRAVPLTDEAVEALRRMKVAAGGSAYVSLSLRRLAQLRRWVGTDGRLPAKFDLRPSLIRDYHGIQNAASQAMAKAAAKAGHKAPAAWTLGSVHDLRKTWCTLAAATLPMHVLRDYAGHTDIATTAKFYCRTTKNDAAKLREAMAG